jgi:hypothetical protein
VKKILLTAILFGLYATVRAETTPSTAFSTRSISGQFVVHTTGADSAQSTRLITSSDSIRLAPSWVVVSCERIKQSLWRTLKAQPSSHGKIFINLHSARSEDENVTIVSEKFADGWQYRVQMPDVLNRDRYVRVIVQVLLMEMVNRNSPSRSVEIPLWLVEGMSRELIALDKRDKIFLDPPTKEVNGVMVGEAPPTTDVVWTNSLGRAHDILINYAPLTFDELSWPADDQLAGGASEIYQSSAHLLVKRLMEFSDGPDCLRAMMAALPTHFNWQLAFLAGFKPHFQGMLDVEKWWAVQVAQFTGRDLTQTWSLAESWDKLDEIIRAPAQVRTSGSDIPLRTEVKLQALVRDSNNIEQTQFYRQKLYELEALRVRVSQKLVGLVDDYRAAIATYLQKQTRTTPFAPVGKQGALMTNPAAKELVRKLDALDAKRMAMKPAPENVSAVSMETSAAYRN